MVPFAATFYKDSDLSPSREACRAYSSVGVPISGAVAVGRVELEPEDAWLRYRLRRFRAILRRVKDHEAGVLLRELIADAEDRLDSLENMRAQDGLK